MKLLNKYIKSGDNVFRILLETEETVLLLRCGGNNLPKWERTSTLVDSEVEKQPILPEREYTAMDYAMAQSHFNMIADVLAVIDDKKARSQMIEKLAADFGISRPTICKYINLYLTYDCKEALLPQVKNDNTAKPLSFDEKNIRWALNKYYYTTEKHSLTFAYKQMIKERYYENGELKLPFPSFYKFRYYYRKHNKKSNEIISRYGTSYYRRNERPLLGEGVQQFAKGIGTGMVDATICDIYLVDDAGMVVGRPILTACVDAFSGLCMGYSLGWEGGMYSVRNMLLNIVCDKKEHCRKLGISINADAWNCSQLPARFITDQGTEYTSQNFDQLTELGCTVTNLDPYIANDKGMVEKFFDLIQETYKPLLKGRGVIEDDFGERGAPDYRKTASLTLADFEKIIVQTIVFYNSRRLLRNFPFTEDMLTDGVKPYASAVWNWGMEQPAANLIQVSEEQLILTLLPRTTAQFTRKGLIVNGLRYKNRDFTERYLDGKDATVAYNPDDMNKVWLLENGGFVPFSLIESRYEDLTMEQVADMKQKTTNLVRGEKERSLLAEVELMKSLEAIVSNCGSKKRSTAELRNIRDNRTKEATRTHRKLEVS